MKWAWISSDLIGSAESADFSAEPMRLQENDVMLFLTRFFYANGSSLLLVLM